MDMTYVTLPTQHSNYQKEERDIPIIGKKRTWMYMCQCGTTIQSRTQLAGEYEIYKEERDALEEEMRKFDECGMK